MEQKKTCQLYHVELPKEMMGGGGLTSVMPTAAQMLKPHVSTEQKNNGYSFELWL